MNLSIALMVVLIVALVIAFLPDHENNENK